MMIMHTQGVDSGKHPASPADLSRGHRFHLPWSAYSNGFRAMEPQLFKLNQSLQWDPDGIHFQDIMLKITILKLRGGNETLFLATCSGER